MASTYTAKLRLTMPATGDLTGLWGGTVNTEITSLIEQAIAGRAAIAMTDADYTPTALNGASDEARNMVLKFTGTLTANRNIILPTQPKLFFIENATTGGFSLTAKTAAGTGVVVPNGSTTLVRCDGTNIVIAYNQSASTLSGAVPIANGGTGQTTAALARGALGATTVGDAVFVATDAAAARTALALGTADTPTFASVNVGSINGGPLAGLRNVVINGCFRINNGNAGVPYVSAATLAAGNYGHEMWKAGASGGDYTFTQLATPTTITIGSGKSLIQVIDGTNVEKTDYVLSWPGTATARVGVNSATPSGSYAASPILITGQTIGAVMSIEFTNGTLGKVMCEPGTVPTVFERRPKSVEVKLTEPYFELAPFNVYGYQSTINERIGCCVTWRTEKRTAPSIGALIADPSASQTSTNVSATDIISAGIRGCVTRLIGSTSAEADVVHCGYMFPVNARL